MPRRDPFSRPITVVLGSALLVGAIAGTYKLLGSHPHHAQQADAQQKVIQTQNLVLNTSDPATAKAKSPMPVRVDSPLMMASLATTRPAELATATTQPVDIAQAFSDADAKIKANDLLGARTTLVAAIDSKTLTPAQVDDAYRRLSQINETVVFSPRKFISDPYQVSYTVQPGDRMQKIANWYNTTVGLICRINNISDASKMQAGQSLKIIKGPFDAAVNKTAFTLDIYIGKPGDPGSVFVKRFRVGLGENDSTPTGEWGIGKKLINPKYYNSRNTGPRTVDAAAPTNPLGDRWLALVGLQGQAVGKTSYGIHGTIDPTSIGQKKSEGCIRMLNEDVELVYDLLITNKSTVMVTE